MKNKTTSMNSAETWDILLYGETSKVNVAKLKALLVDFTTTYISSEEDAFKILPSDLYTVSSLLVQKLIKLIRHAFITPDGNNTKPNVGVYNVLQFLKQDINCYLMLTLSLVCHKVTVYYPELAELVLVILKSALCTTTDFMQSCDDNVSLTPVYGLVVMGTQQETDQSKILPPNERQLSFHTPQSFLLYLIDHICVKKDETFNFLNNFRFSLLLLSLYEGLCYKGDLYSLARLPDCIQQLQSVTNLLNDVINHWSKCCLQLRDSGATLTNRTTLFYVTAILVRIWLSIPVHFPHITTAEDLKALVVKPLSSIITACVNLKVDTYDSNPALSQEFGVVALELLYTALCYVDISSKCPSHSLNVITPFMENILTDECNSIFMYLVSKLCISSVFPSSKEGEGKEVQLLVAGIIDRLTSVASYISSERNRCLKPSTEKVRNGNLSSSVNLVESEVMIRNISKFAMILFGICGDLPDIQISLIKLLSQTVCDPVVIVETFLPSLPARLPSFFDNPSILSLYLDLLEKAWFQQSSDIGGDSSWWEILVNYLKLLQCSEYTIVLEVLYHIQCILGHSSVSLRTHLCRYVVGPFLSNQLKLFKDGLTSVTSVDSNERKRYNSFILLLLKLFHKVVSDESCLELLADAGVVQLIFVLLLSREFCDNTVKLLQAILMLNSDRKTGGDLPAALKTIVLQVMHSILKIVMSLSSAATIKKVILAMVDSAKPLRTGLFTEIDIDLVHTGIVKQFESKKLSLELIKEEFYNDFQICSSLWDVIASIATKDEWLLKYIADSHVWELVKVMAPSLGIFLTHTRQVSNVHHGNGLVQGLQRTSVMVLCKQLQLACCFLKSKESQITALTMFLKDIQESLQGSRVVDVVNGHRLCSELLNCSTVLQSPKQSSTAGKTPLNQPSQSSTGSDVISAGRKKLRRKRRSKLELSTIGPMLCPTLADTMEMSGYDGDIEREAIVGKVDKDSLPPQDGYLGKIVFFSPIFNTLNLIRCEASPDLTASCACNIELFLRHLLLLLLSCDENYINCANKGILAHVLHCCGVVFKSHTATTLRCCDLIAEIALTLNKEKLSIQEAKQLVIAFQNNKELLGRLPKLLYRLTDTPFHPMSYVKFSYSKPQTNCDTADLIIIPSTLNITHFTANGISSTLWLCVTKYSFPVLVHIVSYPIDEHCFLQMWVCCCTGNVIISITSRCDWQHIGDDMIASSSVTVFGSVITLNVWNHLVVSTCKEPHHRNDSKNFKLSVLVDGEEFKVCTLEASPLIIHDKGKTCYLAGGATSEHTKDESLELLEASSQQISWKLGSFVIYQGCINSKLAQHLYMLGPNCASSDLRTLQLCGFPLQAAQLASSNRVGLLTRTFTMQNVVQLLENPLLAYGSHDSAKSSSWQYVEHISSDRQKHYICFPQIERVMLTPAAQRCTRMVSQIALTSAVGISGILYLYAKVVEINCSEECQASCLHLLMLMMKRLPHTRVEFEEIGGIELVQQVLRTPQAAVGYKMADIFFSWCCEGGSDNSRITNVNVLKHILLDWHIWHKAPNGTWSYVLNKLANWINPSCDHFQENILQFRKADAITRILLTSKERLTENMPSLPADIVKQYVNLVGLMFGSPPNLECFSHICDHLLVPDLNDVKFVSLSRQDSSFSLLEASEIAAMSKPDETHSSPYSMLHVNSDPGISVASGNDEQLQQQQQLLRSHSNVPTDELDHPRFDIQPSVDRIPGSSYNSEDHTPFSWVNVTGLVPLKEGGLEDVPASLEVGLLAELRKQILLLPDGQVKRTFGKIISPECLLTMLNNKSILIRTAVIRVLDEYFNRAPESNKLDFITMKGFDLLAWQLSKFSMSLELIIALLSIVLGGRIDQRSFLSGTVSIPEQLTGFQMHAVIPLLKCIMNTVSQPLLCHATLTVLLQLFQNIPGMAVFLHEHGLLKILCQLTVVASDSAKSEDSELILKDVFCFCKLIAFLAASSSQDNILGIMESLLVCLKWCKEKVEQEKDKNSKSVLYLHLLHCKTLQSTLKLFCENLEPTSIPTLSATDQSSVSSSNLSNHFLRVAIAAVDTVVFSTHAYKTEQVGLFISKDLSLPAGLRSNSKATVTEYTLAFTKFLLYYFHKALTADPKKLSSTSNLNKYAATHRHSLYEQYARILGCLCLPQHDTSFHCVVLEEFSEMNDSIPLLTTLLNHATLRKRLASRLILTILNILTALPNLMDSPIYIKLNSLYEAVVKTTSTGLRQSTRLTSLLLWQQEPDPRNKQKLELAIDDMRNNDQRWKDRHEHDSQAYDERNKKLFMRILDKMEGHYQSIISISDEVSSQVLNRQNDLRHRSLQQMNLASRREHEILGAWRKIVLHNTHPCALWSNEEKRVMCWQLDPTEGPCRERRRLMQVPRNIDDKYILDEGMKSTNEVTAPLSYIFENTVYHANSAFSQKIAMRSDEQIIVISRCQSISQDNYVNGHFIITTGRFLFHGDKPLDDPSISTLLPWDSERALLSWEHNEVVEVHRRRYSLKDNAMEIFLINGITMFLSFDSTKDRNTIHAEILNLGLLNIIDSGESDGDKVRVLVDSWQQGEISNFEYLVELNKLAGRTFNDLMQYPVMPFILADYHSNSLDLNKESVFRKFQLPISIQDLNKRQKYLDTYTYLQEEYRKGHQPSDSNPPSKPYHYGSHYSNSGIVLHFLVRVPPFTQMFLSFQGNSFDIPDRTFHHLATTWRLSSSESTSDVKELIPEFFYFPEFLLNRERFKFGERQSGERVDHVILPAWSNNDPRLFILKHRQALECEYVSSHLHEWVDLVFGYRQTGKPAIEAVNVFHPATYYEEGFDIDKITDSTQQAALRAMVKTYGQMPRQLFKEPHPARNKMTVFTTFRIRIGTVLKRLTADSVFDKLENVYIPLYISSCKPRLKQPSLYFIGDPGRKNLEVVFTESVERYPSSLLYLSESEGLIIVGTSTAFFPMATGPQLSLLLLWSLWDNSVDVKSFTGKEIKLHHSLIDKISCCEIAHSGQLIVLAGSLGLVYCWSITNTSQKLSADSLSILRGHEAAVKCMSACRPFGFVVTGSDDCTCIIWDTNRICYVNTLRDHEGPVTVVATSPTLGDIVTVCKQAPPTVEGDAAASGCVLRLWSINGTLVNKTRIESEITCLAYTTAPEGVYVNVIASGMKNGRISLWSSWDLSLIRDVVCPHQSPVKVVSLVFSSCSKELYAGYSNKTIVCWTKPDDNEVSSNGYVLVDRP